LLLAVNYPNLDFGELVKSEFCNLRSTLNFIGKPASAQILNGRRGGSGPAAQGEEDVLDLPEMGLLVVGQPEGVGVDGALARRPAPVTVAGRSQAAGASGVKTTSSAARWMENARSEG